MTKYLITEVKLFRVEGKDKDDALAKFTNDDEAVELLDVEVKVESA